MFVLVRGRGSARAPLGAVAQAALALDPPLGLVSVELPPEPLLVSEGVALVSALFVELLSPASVFAADFVSLAPGFDSLDEGFFEP